MTFRSSVLEKRRIPPSKGAAHHWLFQRLSAVALLFLSLWVMVGLYSHAHDSYQDLLSWLSFPLTSIGIFLFLEIAFYHSRLGIQVIIEDYIRPPLRKLMLTFLKTVVWIVRFIALFFLIRIMEKGGWI